jgi:hypothetical protein
MSKELFLAKYGTAEHAGEAVNSKDEELRSAGAENPHLSQKHMDKIMSSKDDWNGKWGLSRNIATPEKHIHTLTLHKDGEVQRNALIHPNVDPNDIDRALDNNKVWAGARESIVKSSPHITKEQLEKIANSDPHNHIKAAAKERLKDFK